MKAGGGAAAEEVNSGTLIDIVGIPFKTFVTRARARARAGAGFL